MRILAKDARGCLQVINIESATYVNKGEGVEIEDGVLACMRSRGLLIHSVAGNWYLAAGLTFKECSKIIKHLYKKKQYRLYKDYDCAVYPLYDVAKIQSLGDFLDDDDLDEDDEDFDEDEDSDDSDEDSAVVLAALIEDNNSDDDSDDDDSGEDLSKNSDDVDKFIEMTKKFLTDVNDSMD